MIKYVGIQKLCIATNKFLVNVHQTHQSYVAIRITEQSELSYEL